MTHAAHNGFHSTLNDNHSLTDSVHNSQLTTSISPAKVVVHKGRKIRLLETSRSRNPTTSSGFGPSQSSSNCQDNLQTQRSSCSLPKTTQLDHKKQVQSTASAGSQTPCTVRRDKDSLERPPSPEITFSSSIPQLPQSSTPGQDSLTPAPCQDQSTGSLSFDTVYDTDSSNEIIDDSFDMNIEETDIVFRTQPDTGAIDVSLANHPSPSTLPIIHDIPLGQGHTPAHRLDLRLFDSQSQIDDESTDSSDSSDEEVEEQSHVLANGVERDVSTVHVQYPSDSRKQRALAHLETYPISLLNQLLTATQILDTRERSVHDVLTQNDDPYFVVKRKYLDGESESNENVEDGAEEEDSSEDELISEGEDCEATVEEDIEANIVDERRERRLREKKEDELIGVKMTLKNRKTGGDRNICFPDDPGRSPKSKTSMYQITCILRVASLLYEAILTDCVMTKRDIYYKDVGLFKSQATVDKLVDDIVATADLKRQDFNVRATSKGLIATNCLKIVLKTGFDLNVSSTTGCLIPPTEDLSTIESTSRDLDWVLIVEKDAVFQTLCSLRLLDDKRLGGGAIVTGKGFPDLSTIQLLSRLSERFPNAHFYALVDADPHGISILSTYTRGSSSTRFTDEYIGLALGNKLTWLGVRTSEIIRDSLGARHDELLQLTRRDVELANSMLRDPTLPNVWKRELSHMLHLNRKAEIQIISGIGGGVGSLVEYIVERIEN